MEPDQTPSNPSIKKEDSIPQTASQPISSHEETLLSTLADTLSSTATTTTTTATTNNNNNNNNTHTNGSNNNNNIDDDDDPIVREIDVYISPELSNQMNLIQFPLQQASHAVPANTAPTTTVTTKGKKKEDGEMMRPHTSLLPESARIKPQHSMLELEYSIPRNFSSSRQVPEVLDFSKRTFSSQSVSIASHMAIGLFDPTGTKIDLVPLNKIYQMRPTFSHVDALFDDEDLEARKKEEEQEKEKEKPILFQKRANDRQVNAQRTSYAFKKADEDSEEWIPLDVHGHKSLEKKEAIKKCHCPHESRDIDLEFAKVGETPNIGYVKSLNYLPTQDVSGFAEEDFMVPTGASIHDMDIDDEGGTNQPPSWKKELTSRIATILQRKGGVPFPYAVIRSRFNASVTDEILIEALSSSAVMLRGNFILKSSLIAFSSPHVADARDLILTLLNNYGYVQRQKLINVYKALDEDDPAAIVVTPSVINNILKMIGKPALDGMEPKIDDDIAFITTFSHLLRMHTDYWERKEVALQKYLDLYENIDTGMESDGLETPREV